MYSSSLCAVVDKQGFRAMRKGVLSLLCFFLFTGVGGSGPETFLEIRVDMDYARLVKMPAGARSLVLGNPAIADATLLRDGGLLVVSGKSFGATNLIILDKTGRQVLETLVSVVPAQDKLVVFRGVDRRESFACDPLCVRAIDAGDDPQHVTQSVGVYKAHEELVSPGRK